MKTTFSLTIAFALFAYLVSPDSNAIIIVNPHDTDYNNCRSSIEEEYIRDVMVGDFTLSDENGKEIPYYITTQKMVVFPLSIKAGKRVEYILIKGTPTLTYDSILMQDTPHVEMRTAVR